MRKFCCLIEEGVTPMARSRNHVAWSKRETYICEFMWLVKSYSEASTAPLKVLTHSDMLRLSIPSERLLPNCHPERGRAERSASESKDLRLVSRNLEPVLIHHSFSIFDTNSAIFSSVTSVCSRCGECLQFGSITISV